jgi:methionine S-methyltransferase
VKAIFQFLRDPSFSGTRNALDLSFPSEAVADEKIAFLAHLAKYLQTLPSFPYEQAAGSDTFRHHLATFLCLYFRIPLNQGNLVIAPSRPILIENVITIYAPRLALVDGSLTAGLPRKWLATQPPEEGGPRQSGELGPVVIEAPSRADLVLKLIKALKLELVVVALPDYEVRDCVCEWKNHHHNHKNVVSATMRFGL